MSERYPLLTSCYPLLFTSDRIILFQIVMFSAVEAMPSWFLFSHLLSPSFSRQGEQSPFKVSCFPAFFGDSLVRAVKILRFTGQTLKTTVLSNLDPSYIRESSCPSVADINHLLDTFNKTN